MRFVSCTGVFTPLGAGSARSPSCDSWVTTVSPSTYPGTARSSTRSPRSPTGGTRSSPPSQPGDVLVGHSGGGFDATLAADAVPEHVSHITYLAAALPREGRTYPEAMAMRDDGDDLGDEFDADVGEMLGYLTFDDDGAMTFADFDGAWKYFYHDCDEATARWAFDRLGPERFGDTTVTPVSVSALLGGRSAPQLHPVLQDRSMPRWLADTVTRRLGVDQLTIDTSHSPFLSRPRELAELLVHATTTKPTGPLVPN